MVKEGKSSAEIGRELGKTKNSIVGKCKRIGLELRCPSFTNPRYRKTAFVPLKHPPKPKKKVKPEVVAEATNVTPMKPNIVHPPASYKRKELPVLEMDTKPTSRLRPGDCKFPVEFKNEEWHMCCRARWGTMPYCEEHCEVAYQPPQARKRAA